MNRNCTVTPSSIYYIPENSTNQRPAIEVKVKNVSYEVNPKSLSWWQKLSTMQLPWEWVENSAPQQVLNNVSFSVKSGQMLAIMGNSGMCTFNVCEPLYSRRLQVKSFRSSMLTKFLICMCVSYAVCISVSYAVHIPFFFFLCLPHLSFLSLIFIFSIMSTFLFSVLTLLIYHFFLCHSPFTFFSEIFFDDHISFLSLLTTFLFFSLLGTLLYTMLTTFLSLLGTLPSVYYADNFSFFAGNTSFCILC